MADARFRGYDQRKTALAKQRCPALSPRCCGLGHLSRRSKAPANVCSVTARWRCVRCCRAAGAATFWNSRARHAADAGAGIAQGRRRLVIGTTGIRQSKAETCIWLDPLPGSSIHEGRLTLRLGSCVPVGSTYIIFKKASKKERQEREVYRV